MFHFKGKWNLIQVPEVLNGSHTYLDRASVVMILGWFALQCILYILPLGGPISKGVELRYGKRIEYRLNGKYK